MRNLKKLLAVMLCALAVTLCAAALADVEISEAAFPDPAFREYVKGADDDKNGSLSEKELTRIKVISLGNPEMRSAKGLEYFTELMYLDSNAPLTFLDLSGNTKLVSLRFGKSELTTLDLSHNPELYEILCERNNQLTGLDLTHNNKMVTLDCFDNPNLTFLKLGIQPKLGSLCCYSNQLAKVDISECDKLREMVENYEPTLETFEGHNYRRWKSLASNAINMILADRETEFVIRKTNPAPAEQPQNPAPAEEPKPQVTDKAAAFVSGCYKVILGRDPDEGGLDYWTSRLKAKPSSPADIIYSFISSNEFQAKRYSAKQVIETLYRSMLGRSPDEGGMNYWLGRVNGGASYADLVNGFGSSNEFKTICSQYGIYSGFATASGKGNTSVPTAQTDTTQARSFVTRCYQIILKRDPDAGGLDYWTGAIVKGKTASQMIYGFITSNEFRNRNLNNRGIIETLYLAALNRTPDQGGMTYWLERMDRGDSLAAVVNGFCDSDEFRNVCAQHRIQPGKVAEGGKNVPETNGNKEQAEHWDEGKVKAFIARIYPAAFSRNAGEEETGYWANLILTGGKTPKQVVRDILTSSEFRARGKQGEDLIRTLYRVYFNREADEAGLGYWMGKINEGATTDQLPDGFASSAEFKAIVNGLK